MQTIIRFFCKISLYIETIREQIRQEVNVQYMAELAEATQQKLHEAVEQYNTLSEEITEREASAETSREFRDATKEMKKDKQAMEPQITESGKVNEATIVGLRSAKTAVAKEKRKRAL